MAQEFVQKHLALLELEKEAELEEARCLLECTSSKQLSLKGLCFPKLLVTGQSTGLYGRTLITLEPAKHHGIATLPASRITNGDIAGIYPSNSTPSDATQILTGLIWQVRSAKITVAVENQEEKLQEGALYMMVKLASDITYKRLKRALNDLNKSSSNHLQGVLFGEAALGSPTTYDLSGFKFFNRDLDESQQDAVVFALHQREVAVIHGPPGTGKTTTVVEIIHQAVCQGMKVLACAPSNIAVDNLVEKLAASKDNRIVRIGHPARLLAAIQRFSLDAQLSASDAGRLLADVRREIDQTLERASKSNRRGADDRRSTWSELKHLRKELRERERAALRMLLQQADVVLATNTGIYEGGPVRLLADDHFDIVVIDECAQAIEASCWIPLRAARRCVLAGDHKQLPPTIVSEKAAKDGLAISLMERIISLHGNTVVRMLNTQYRMNSVIMQWSSQAMYNNQLRAHSSVSSHLLRDLSNVDDNDVTSTPLLLIDTVGCSYNELDLEQEASKGNEGEANLVAVHVERLCLSGVKPEDIAVITPYNLQVELLRHRLSAKYQGLEIKSVDGFQGREKEAVVMSLVRSNSEGEVGFLAEDRRMNVAVTRARRHFCLVCDSQTVSHHMFLKELIDYMSEHGEVHSAFQYTQEVDDLWTSHPLPEHLVSTSRVQLQQPRMAEIPIDRSTRPKTKLTVTAKSKTTYSKPGSREDSERGDEEVKGKFADDLEVFVRDSKRMILEFPETLSSRDRFIIHELCSETELFHESRGVGAERRIIVSKQPIRQLDINQSDETDHEPISRNTDGDRQLPANEEVIELTNSFGGVNMGGELIPEGSVSTDDSVHQSRSAEITGLSQKPAKSGASKSTKTGSRTKVQGNDDKSRKCKFCKKDIPVGNFILHEIQCEKVQADKEALKCRTNLRGKMDKSKQKNLLENTQETDPDKLMEIARKQDGLCNFRKCKERVSLIGLLCEHCNRRYCLSHHVPEVHGCGELAKKEALRSRRADLTTTKQENPKKSDKVKRVNLQRKLDTKMSEMEESRQRKGRKKKK